MVGFLLSLGRHLSLAVISAARSVQTLELREGLLKIYIPPR